MNINDTIRQSIANIPAVQSFLKKRIIRWWDKIYWAPPFLAIFGVLMVLPVLMVLQRNSAPYTETILSAPIISVVPVILFFFLLVDVIIGSVGVRPLIKQCQKINLGTSQESLSQIIAVATQEEKLAAINALLETDADRALIENVIALSETDLPNGWWSFLKEVAEQSMPETIEVELSTQEKMSELLSQAKENNLSRPVKKQWKI